ncbi:MAG TPA: NTP transferase domain-containing protein, partial [Thermoanaerobaculia bacterium]|nr:NTP transferase domain-containing protein [Thermoanaerobaculia bacterium]
MGAIPARFASTRLPGKPLLPIAGRPMIEHVYTRVAGVRGLDRVVVVTDDERIAQAVAAFGGEVEMTPPECASGTDRIAHAARGW